MSRAVEPASPCLGAHMTHSDAVPVAAPGKARQLAVDGHREQRALERGRIRPCVGSRCRAGAAFRRAPHGDDRRPQRTVRSVTSMLRTARPRRRCVAGLAEIGEAQIEVHWKWGEPVARGQTTGWSPGMLRAANTVRGSPCSPAVRVKKAGTARLPSAGSARASPARRPRSATWSPRRRELLMAVDATMWYGLSALIIR